MWRDKIRSMGLDSISKLAGTLQALVVTIAVVVGGVYALYTFRASRSADIANEEFAKLHNSLLDLRIEASQENGINPQESYVRATVFAENKGNSRITLRLRDKPPLWIAKVTSFSTQDDPAIGLDRPIKSYIRIGADDSAVIGDQIIRPTETYRYPVIFRVRDKGVYLVVFEATVQEEDHRGLEDRKWLASTYVIVR
jgi:hypothetical protein